MSDKRYYYTDPLAAAWMAKHFGMTFIYQDDNGWPLPPDKHAYVHTDSLPILEPRFDDVIHNGCCGYYYTVVEEWIRNWSGQTDVEIELAREWFSGTHNGRIIQRDGKPFHWPQFDQS